LSGCLPVESTSQSKKRNSGYRIGEIRAMIANLAEPFGFISQPRTTARSGTNVKKKEGVA
jgi:hypothetical protein